MSFVPYIVNIPNHDTYTGSITTGDLMQALTQAYLDALYTAGWKYSFMNAHNLSQFNANDKINIKYFRDDKWQQFTPKVTDLADNFVTEVDNKSIVIKPASVKVLTYRTGTLRHVNKEDIERELGFAANAHFDPEKVTHCWAFTVNDTFAAIWDYKGSADYDEWSTYDPNNVLRTVFNPDDVTKYPY